MKQITVRDGQTMLDIALEYYGDASAVVALAADNGLTVGAPLSAGQILDIDPERVADKQITGYYATRNIKPSTKYDNYGH